jgi:hypothetical protein
MHAYSQQELECIKTCQSCSATCYGMAMTHCLEVGGDHVRPQHFRLMLECARLCDTAADLMLSKSRFHRQLCEICAEACDACLESCSKLDGMEECAAICRVCAQHCRHMAQS